MPPDAAYTPAGCEHLHSLSFAIVISLQLAIFKSTSSLQYTNFSCQEYVFSSVKLSQFLQYLPKYALQSSSCFTTLKDQQSGLDIER